MNKWIMEGEIIVHANTLYTCSPDVEYPKRRDAADLVYTPLAEEEIDKLRNLQTKASLPVFVSVGKQ